MRLLEEEAAALRRRPAAHARGEAGEPASWAPSLHLGPRAPAGADADREGEDGSRAGGAASARPAGGHVHVDPPSWKGKAAEPEAEPGLSSPRGPSASSSASASTQAFIAAVLSRHEAARKMLQDPEGLFPAGRRAGEVAED